MRKNQDEINSRESHTKKGVKYIIELASFYTLFGVNCQKLSAKESNSDIVKQLNRIDISR